MIDVTSLNEYERSQYEAGLKAAAFAEAEHVPGADTRAILGEEMGIYFGMFPKPEHSGLQRALDDHFILGALDYLYTDAVSVGESV